MGWPSSYTETTLHCSIAELHYRERVTTSSHKFIKTVRRDFLRRIGRERRGHSLAVILCRTSQDINLGDGGAALSCSTQPFDPSLSPPLRRLRSWQSGGSSPWNLRAAPPSRWWTGRGLKRQRSLQGHQRGVWIQGGVVMEISAAE